MSAELAARRTAAAAAAADFHAAAVAFQRGGEQPDYAVWAQRLERHLLYVLDALAAGDTGLTRVPRPKPQPEPELAEIRLVLDAFEWGVDDLQYALEKIDAIVNRNRRAARREQLRTYRDEQLRRLQVDLNGDGS